MFETAISQPVMILSHETARHFFSDEAPIGRTLRIGPSTGNGRRDDVTVVGVVGDVRYLELEQVPGNTMCGWGRTAPPNVPPSPMLPPKPMATADRLGYGDDARTSPRVADGFAHQLLDGLISEPSQVPQKLPVIYEIRS